LNASDEEIKIKDDNLKRQETAKRNRRESKRIKDKNTMDERRESGPDATA